MPDRRPVPLLIVLILGVLTISAAVSGLLLAPSTPELTVQNAAGENLLAPSLSVHIVATQTNILGKQVQTLPTATQDVTFDPSETPDTSTQAGIDASVVLNLLHHIQQSSPWVASQNAYRYTGDVASLLGIPAEAQSSTGLIVRVETAGTAHAWVSGGYLAAFFVRFSLTTSPVVRKATELVEFRKVGDYETDLTHVHT